MTGYTSKKAAAQDKLAQPAQEPVECLDCGSHNVGIPATYDSLVNSVKAQPAQEPAFWLNEQGQLWATRGDAERHSIGQKIISLYTTPQPEQEPDDFKIFIDLLQHEVDRLIAAQRP